MGQTSQEDGRDSPKGVDGAQRGEQFTSRRTQAVEVYDEMASAAFMVFSMINRKIDKGLFLLMLQALVFVVFFSIPCLFFVTATARWLGSNVHQKDAWRRW